MPHLRALGFLLCGSLAAPALAIADSRAAPPAPEVIAAWNRVPASELEALWAGAQQTAGIVAIEPDSHSVGGQAARKKAWGFLNLGFRLVIGSEPIWFPVDAVKRTVCGAETYWSYHTLHKERDVHPWLARDNVFEGLMDARQAEAVVGSRVLDLAHCSEMRGGPDRPCLYGEVTAPKAFDEWFCAGDCGPALGADPRGVPGGFGRPEAMCFHGPFVLERVHDWRPEIHPAEVMWSRPRAADPSWRVLLVPDLSERFSRDDHYARRHAGAPRRWTGDRPVELWVAFATAPGQPLVFDLAASELPGPRPAPSLELRPPDADGAFQPLPAPKGMVIAARTWAAPDGAGRRGLLVLRAPIAATKGRARLFALQGRRPEAAAAAWPFARTARVARGAAAPPPPEVRLLPYARVRRAGQRHALDVLVRFDPLRPPQPGDERLADTYNAALAGSSRKRRRQFGSDRPLRLDLVLEARDAECRPVPLVRAGERPPAGAVVLHEVRRGEATGSVNVIISGRPRAREEFGAAVTVGGVTMEVPPGVTVSGTARVAYVGGAVLPLRAAEVPVALRVPAPSFADEWELVAAVLSEIDASTQAQRLEALREDACAPLGPACTLDEFAAEAARRAAEPAGRWPALQHQADPARSFARFLRHLAVAFTWDGDVEYEEYARLSRLLSRIYAPGAAPPQVQGRCAGR